MLLMISETLSARNILALALPLSDVFDRVRVRGRCAERSPPDMEGAEGLDVVLARALPLSDAFDSVRERL